MASKKFKSAVEIQSTVKITQATPERAMIVNASGELVNSTVVTTELERLAGLTSAIIEAADVGANSGVASLDANGKIPSSQLPAIAVTDVFPVADIAARDALTVGAGDGEVQEGDVAIVVDASADAAITAGAASYIYGGSSWLLLKAGDEVLSVNGQTGVVALDADDINDAATTNKFATAAQLAKIDFLAITQAVDLDQMESDIATNNAKVSADGSVVTHNDVTNAGSGIIISAAERTKLDGIEVLATTDQTGAEIKVAYEAEADTNAYTDAEKSKLAAIEALATADQTGAEIKIAYEAEADTNAYDDAAVTKLGGVEALADVTDATNVEAAGAVMESDTTTASMSFVIDEDDMSSDLDTKVPTQQSVKAFVEAQAAAGGNLSSGDIKEASFSGAADTATDLAVTGLAFANGTVRSFNALVSVLVDATADLYETFNLLGIQKAAGWDMSVEATGDESLVSFDISAAGQVTYSKLTTAGWTATTLKFRADTISV